MHVTTYTRFHIDPTVPMDSNAYKLTKAFISIDKVVIHFFTEGGRL